MRHESHSSIKSTQIPKYNAKRSFKMCVRRDFTHLRRDHESLSSIKSNLILKPHAKQSV
ncbi:uncharacterized protein G2W53_014488 [Senna tora]|uniref:Uncharacterized protein n=1 Tax=Senna tora TaxID=362788 RepID=A0A835C5R5_9FABA|nr:uncharacterized protein G2W53_014488 [Senna tora]